MLPIFRKKTNEEPLKKELFAFLNELEKNLESFYVMDQRQFITQGFLLETWGNVKDRDIIKRHGSIAKYAAATEDFNHSLKAHKEFETWYTSDINHKTPDNARKLHAMKNELDLKLRAMEALIILAGQDLEREMIRLGMLRS